MIIIIITTTTIMVVSPAGQSGLVHRSDASSAIRRRVRKTLP
jgi:hypothetical protein